MQWHLHVLSSGADHEQCGVGWWAFYRALAPEFMGKEFGAELF